MIQTRVKESGRTPMSTLSISWSPEFETGIDIIDQQHQRMFAYLEEINHAIATNDGGEVEKVIRELIDYSLCHNAFEESLMEQAGYPMLEAHRDVHLAFKVRAHSYAFQLSQGNDPLRLAREIRTDIALWLTNHIRHEDQHYVVFVKRSLCKNFVSRMLTRFFG